MPVGTLLSPAQHRMHIEQISQENLIGGIYSRPVVLGNFAHFLGVAIVLIKQVPATANTATIATGAVAYSIFAPALAPLRVPAKVVVADRGGRRAGL